MSSYKYMKVKSAFMGKKTVIQENRQLRRQLAEMEAERDKLKEGNLILSEENNTMRKQLNRIQEMVFTIKNSNTEKGTA